MVEMSLYEAKEEIVHGVDDDLLNEIKVRQARELSVTSCMFFNKVHAGCWVSECAILVTKCTLLLISPRNESWWIANSIIVRAKLIEKNSPFR